MVVFKSTIHRRCHQFLQCFFNFRSVHSILSTSSLGLIFWYDTSLCFFYLDQSKTIHIQRIYCNYSRACVWSTSHLLNPWARKRQSFICIHLRNDQHLWDDLTWTFGIFLNTRVGKLHPLTNRFCQCLIFHLS